MIKTVPQQVIDVFVHGNVSSAIFWESVLHSLPTGFRGLTCDLRGYGESESLPVDATLGLSDMVDDIGSLVEAPVLRDFTSSATAWAAALS